MIPSFVYRLEVNNGGMLMNKMVKAIVLFSLAGCLSLSASSVAFAAENLELLTQSTIKVQPRYAYVNYADCSVSDLGNDKATVNYLLSGSSEVTKIVASAVVQVKSASGSYTTAKTLASRTFNSTNADYATTVSIDSGKTYRLKVTFKVYVGKIAESVITYSSDT